MKKSALFLTLALLMTGLCTGCDDEDFPQDEFGSGKELFAFPSAEATPAVTDGDAADDMDDGDNPEFGNTYNRDEPIDNPMLRYLDGLDSFPPAPPGVDLDFTTFECGWEYDDKVTDMLLDNSEDYLGKKIRMVGYYSGFYYDDFGRYFHYVMVDDAQGCCIQHIELIWNEGTAPDEFPDDYSVIDVVGVLDSYYIEEWGQTEYFLVVDSVTAPNGGFLG